MVQLDSDKYKTISALYEKGEYIKSLKKQCNLIAKEECEKEILIDYRKKLYSIYISGINGIDDEVITMFKCAIEKCTFDNEKYNIPFIKKAISYLEQKNNPDYNLINEWLNRYNKDLLNPDRYGNNKYSDRELYYLKKAKIFDEINNIENLNRLLDDYRKEEKQNLEIDFFIEYHICKLLFKNKQFEEANNHFIKLLKQKRERYVLYLPIKYQDYTRQHEKLFYILEILLSGKTEDYVYAYIINWLRKSDYSDIIDIIQQDFIIVDNNYKIIDKKRIKQVIISIICHKKEISDLLLDGKITNITKSGNGFIKENDKSFFVNKIYIDNSIKNGTTVKFFLIEKYNEEKKYNVKEAILINRRYLNEILRSKKRV